MRRTTGSGMRITAGCDGVVSRTAVAAAPSFPVSLSVTVATTPTSTVNWTRTAFVFGLCGGSEPAEFAAASVAPPEPPPLASSWLSRTAPPAAPGGATRGAAGTGRTRESASRSLRRMRWVSFRPFIRASANRVSPLYSSSFARIGRFILADFAEPSRGGLHAELAAAHGAAAP
ncbi:hypothetical protein [Streptomyces sp. NRRL S-244]|uniref:hypothetical protein n=1 Tax=Streptomyces sp. NRRL S-244 TaxID=1463897 RepID=UPI00131A57E4|nr:hypothetical protein [Streptomyces sp. NRRL S-244]